MIEGHRNPEFKTAAYNTAFSEEYEAWLDGENRPDALGIITQQTKEFGVIAGTMLYSLAVTPVLLVQQPMRNLNKRVQGWYRAVKKTSLKV